MFSKKRYIDTFIEYVSKCVELEKRLIEKALPTNVLIRLGTTDLYEEAQKNGQVKFLGGRYLDASKLKNIKPEDAAIYTFIDGKTPCWVNLLYEGYDKKYSYIRVLYCRDLTDDESRLYDMPEGNKQFRIMLSMENQLNNNVLG